MVFTARTIRIPKQFISSFCSMILKPRNVLILFLVACIWILDFVVPGAASEKAEDLYKLLGVARTATTKEIKQAYRRKALDTHPDKNTGVSKEEAAEAFQKVVHAFEVLSDATSRRQYDRTGRTAGATATNGIPGMVNPMVILDNPDLIALVAGALAAVVASVGFHCWLSAGQ